MKNNLTYKKKLLERLLRFAVKIIKLAGRLPRSPVGFALANQITRSGTSIGANCEEAQDASSRNDFLNKINISLKEAKETCYWLKIIKLSSLVQSYIVEPEINECNEITAILVSSVKTIKNQLKT